MKMPTKSVNRIGVFHINMMVYHIIYFIYVYKKMFERIIHRLKIRNYI